APEASAGEDRGLVLRRSRRGRRRRRGRRGRGGEGGGGGGEQRRGGECEGEGQGGGEGAHGSSDADDTTGGRGKLRATAGAGWWRASKRGLASDHGERRPPCRGDDR